MNKINLQKQKKNVLFTLDDNFNMGEGFTTMHENGNTIFTQKYPTFPTKYSQIHLETVDSVVNKKGIEYDALTNQFSRNEQATFIRGRMKAVEQLIYAEFTNVLNNVTASVIVDLIDRVYCKYGKTLQLDMSNILSSIHVQYMTYNGIPRANVKNESYYDYMAGSLVMITIPNVMTRISEGLYKELYINIYVPGENAEGCDKLFNYIQPEVNRALNIIERAAANMCIPMILKYQRLQNAYLGFNNNRSDHDCWCDDCGNF